MKKTEKSDDTDKDNDAEGNGSNDGAEDKDAEEEVETLTAQLKTATQQSSDLLSQQEAIDTKKTTEKVTEADDMARLKRKTKTANRQETFHLEVLRDS